MKNYTITIFGMGFIMGIALATLILALNFPLEPKNTIPISCIIGPNGMRACGEFSPELIQQIEDWQKK